jgi:hypothetical protein
MIDIKEGMKEIGEITLRGKVDTAIDAYRNKKYENLAEQDLNIIMNCLSNTGYGQKLADHCRNKKVSITINLNEL